MTVSKTSSTLRARWLHFFRGGDYAILLLLLMPILGVWGVSSLSAIVQLIGVGLYLAVVLRWVRGGVWAKTCLWSGICLWFFGLFSAMLVLLRLFLYSIRF